MLKLLKAIIALNLVRVGEIPWLKKHNRKRSKDFGTNIAIKKLS